ncbi:unnamed protein product [Orchesella dallaii]|uniref:Polyglutamine-binding protein 1 n=1 Tax=Orchesella dallaii TaxID=48710 RepID=A0ABP1S3E7_9HEXA
MPLPAALAAKLAKRGLLANKSKAANANPPGFVEEVIAESYDDPKTIAPPQKSKLTLEKEKNKENVTKLIRLGHQGCPNKNNIYHTCSSFCVKQWGVGKTHPEAKYDARRRKMLKKYPLPPGWLEVFDSGLGRYYYWDTATDNVCWHSPQYPKAAIGKSAGDLRVKLVTEGDKQPVASTPSRPDRFEPDKDREKERVYHDNRFRKPDNRDRRRKNRDDDELDPMDPSSYSDVPRGNWSSGLLPEGAKTGVDTTASGSLFQQRPLPSPGAVLRANAEKAGRK